MVQEIASSAEPAEEGRDGEPVDGGDAVRAGVVVMSYVEAKVTEVQVAEASDDSEDAEDETYEKTDEIEGVHVIWCSVWRL